MPCLFSIVRLGRLMNVFLIEYIYMPHHARMCMFGRLPFSLLGDNFYYNVEGIHLESSS